MSTPVFSQGPRPTCLACAIAAAHEAERVMQVFEAAVEPLWWDLHRHGQAGPDGALLTDAAASLGRVGHCASTHWPYNTSLGYRTEDPPDVAGTPPWRIASAILFAPAHDGIEDAVEEALANGHPVVAVIEVTDAFRHPQQPDGFVPVPPIRAASGGYHAVLVVGAWTDPVYGRVFLIRNSWGDWWGAGGYCLLPVAYFQDFCVELARLEITNA
ncbi:C1 family peptidase [Mycobacterium nebraskense]|uniref:C1 family peptidase n=1 Tax=Mycobacterium nebraskense TaxID=244292 RepID=UPI0023F22E6F|nr:C1 family peptidase [Mycobacterium nebraskense]